MNKRELQIEITKIMDRVFRDKTLSKEEKIELELKVEQIRAEMRFLNHAVAALIDLSIAGRDSRQVDPIEENEEKPVKKKAKGKK